MSRYTLRRPEYIKGAETSKYFPSTAIVILISLVIYIACTVASTIVGVVYGLSSSLSKNGSLDVNALLSNLLLVTLFCLGLITLFTAIHVRFIEKRPLRTIGLVKERFALKYIIGFGAGVILLAAVVLPALLTIPGEFTGLKASALIYLAAFIVQSAGEEVLFRGYMLSALTRRGGVVWAVVVSSIVFGLYHIPYPVMQLISAALIGAVLSLFVLRTGSLWSAMGLHAAWNFCLGLITKDVSIFKTDYNFYSVSLPETGPLWLDITQFAILLAVAALLLFAGKNRLVVRKTEERVLIDKAYRMAKQTITDKGQMAYAMRVSELTEDSGGKAAALIYHALSFGASPEYTIRTFGESMFSEADALAVRYGDTPEDYWKRVMQYPAAMSVKNAERRLEEIRRPKGLAGGPGAGFAGLIQCPMLRWSINADYCRNIVQAVDGTASAGPESPVRGTSSASGDYIAMLDHSICRACPVRQTGRYYGEGNYCSS